MSTKIPAFLMSCLNKITFINQTVECEVVDVVAEHKFNRPSNALYIKVKPFDVVSHCPYDIEGNINIGSYEEHDYYSPKITCNYSDLADGGYIIQPFGIKTKVNDKTCTLYMRDVLNRVQGHVDMMSSSDCARFTTSVRTYVNQIHALLQKEHLLVGESFPSGLFSIVYVARELHDQASVENSHVHVFESFC